MGIDRIEVNNETGYALWAESYDFEKNPLIAVEEPYVERLLRGITYSYVLDAGAGTGRYILKLAERGASVTAIDNCPEMLAIAKNSARSSGLNLDFHLASLEDHLPFDGDKFDLVLYALVLNHIPNLTDVIKEFHRVCKEGGHFLATDFHPDSLALGWRTEFSRQGTTYLLPNMEYARQDYLDTIKNAGFTISQVLDVPAREVPKGYIREELINSYGDVNLCLIILGQKRWNFSVRKKIHRTLIFEGA